MVKQSMFRVIDIGRHCICVQICVLNKKIFFAYIELLIILS